MTLNRQITEALTTTNLVKLFVNYYYSLYLYTLRRLLTFLHITQSRYPNLVELNMILLFFFFFVF